MRTSDFHLLDTNICVHLIRERPVEVRKAFEKMSPECIGLSVMTEFELRYGAAKSDDPKNNHAALDAFLRGFTVLPLNEDAVFHSAEIRAALRAQPIGPYDLLIAGHARSLGATLVTRNLKEFQRVPGLKVVAW